MILKNGIVIRFSIFIFVFMEEAIRRVNGPLDRPLGRLPSKGTQRTRPQVARQPLWACREEPYPWPSLRAGEWRRSEPRPHRAPAPRPRRTNLVLLHDHALIARDPALSPCIPPPRREPGSPWNTRQHWWSSTWGTAKYRSEGRAPSVPWCGPTLPAWSRGPAPKAMQRKWGWPPRARRRRRLCRTHGRPLRRTVEEKERHSSVLRARGLRGHGRGVVMAAPACACAWMISSCRREARRPRSSVGEHYNKAFTVVLCGGCFAYATSMAVCV